MSIDWNAQWAVYTKWAHAEFNRCHAHESESERLAAGRWITWRTASVGSDATTLPAQMGFKALNADVAVSHHVPLPPGVASETVPINALPPPTVNRVMRADLLKVPAKCSGKTVHTMLRKVCANVGVSDWFADNITPPSVNWLEETQDFMCHLERLNYSIHLDLWILQQDRGADQVSCTGDISDAITMELFKWIFLRFCSQHGLHLIIKDALKLVEKAAYPNYFGALAKHALILRSGSVFKDIKKCWLDVLRDPVEVATLFRRLVPQAIRGRWGQAHATEAWFLRFDLAVWREIWVMHFTGIDWEDLKDKDAENNEMGMFDDDPDNYRKKLTKWKRASVDDTRQLAFWNTMQITHTSRQPIDHGRRWLMKTLPPDAPPRQVLWTCNQIHVLTEEIEDRLRVEHLSTYWKFMDTIEEDNAKWWGTASLLTLQVHANFNMREVSIYILIYIYIYIY